MGLEVPDYFESKKQTRQTRKNSLFSRRSVIKPSLYLFRHSQDGVIVSMNRVGLIYLNKPFRYRV